MRATPFLLTAVVGSLAAAPSTEAQRVVETREWRSTDGRIMGYYSAALAFTPAGVPLHQGAAASLGLELTLVPPLSRELRTAGETKTQSTNLSPILPRPRLALRLPAALLVEASWIPGLRAFDAKASLWGVSIARPVGMVRDFLFVPRLAVSGGDVEGPITCNDEFRRRGGGDSIYFAFVCHGVESEDRFEPFAVAGEIIVVHSAAPGRLTPYVGAGLRRERNRLDVGVRLADGSRDPVHPILEMRVTRAYLMGGAQWQPRTQLRFGAELFYAPGSLVTVRARADVPLPL